MKFKVWNKENLTGIWEVSLKIDGVRCHKIDGKHYSRKDKELYNIPDVDFEIAEIFCGDFKTTIENTRTFKSSKTILPEHIYLLHPKLDKRLLIGNFENPTSENILDLFQKYHQLGYEGLILKQDNTYLKVKNIETYDVVITDIFEGKGRLKGKLGGFVTTMGNVGTGLTDEERVLYFTKDIIGETIEVECMEITSDNKFRHPRFKRMRYDK
jgi:DNA ligase-1